MFSSQIKTALGGQGVQDEPSQSARPAAEVPAMAQDGVTHPFGSRPNEPSGSRRGTEERESSGDDDEGELLKGTDIPKEAFEKAVEVFSSGYWATTSQNRQRNRLELRG